MFQIIAGDVKLGPYKTVNQLDDRYEADGAHIQFSVIGPSNVEPWDGVYSQPAPPTQEQLLALKSAKNDEINAARLKANRGTFTHAGKEFACDELSRGDIDGINGYVALVGDLPAGWPGGWKAVDNTIHPIADVTAWGAFYASMVAAGNANFGKAQALKAQLVAASTEAQINAIQW